MLVDLTPTAIRWLANRTEQRRDELTAELRASIASGEPFAAESARELRRCVEVISALEWSLRPTR